MDQIFSSASNAFIIFALARVSRTESFGTITLALAALTSSLLISRGLLGVPISLLSDRPRDLEIETGHALTVAACLGVIVCFLIIPLGLQAGGFAMALVLGGAVPVVLVQDVCRFYVTAASRPWAAVASDGLWALSTLLLLLSTYTRHPPLNALGLVIGWALAAFFAALLILVCGGVQPKTRGTRLWLQISRYHRRRFGLDAIIGALGSFSSIWLVGLWLGPSAIAALRGASTVLGPIAVLVSAVQFSAIPDLRRRDLPVDALWFRLSRIALPMSSISLAVGLFAVVVPAKWGELLLGESWILVQSVTPIIGAEYAAISWYAAVTAELTVRARSGSVLGVRTAHVTLSIAAVVLGAALFSSVRAVAAGYVVAAVLATVGGYVALQSNKRRRPSDDTMVAR